MPKRAYRNQADQADKAKSPEENARAGLSIEGGLHSPARRLQSFLDDEFHGESEAVAGRWSTRRTIVFVVLFCGLFWTGAAMLVRLFLS